MVLSCYNTALVYYNIAPACCNTALARYNIALTRYHTIIQYMPAVIH